MKRAFVFLAASACGSFSAADPPNGDAGVADTSTNEDAGSNVPPPAVGAVSLVQQTDIENGPDVATARFDSPLTRGNTVIAVGAWYNDFDPEISSTCGLRFAPIGPATAKGYRIRMFYSEDSAAGRCSISLSTTGPGPVPFALVAFEYAGLAKISPLVDDDSNVAPGAASPIGQLVMRTEPGGLVFAVFTNRENGPVALLPPLVPLASTTAGILFNVGSYIPTVDEQLRVSASAPDGTQWIAIGASFRKAR